MVLITGPASSAPIRQHLPSVLDRIRTLPPAQNLNDAAENDAERSVLGVIRAHIERIWQVKAGTTPTEDDLRSLLSLVHVQSLDVEAGRVGELATKDLLRAVVLHDPIKADSAWSILFHLCAGYAANRGGGDREALQRALLDAGIELQAQRSYRPDIERLQLATHATRDLAVDFSRINIGATDVLITRNSSSALRQAIDDGYLVVVGEPGIGKSGALYDLVRTLEYEGRDVVFLAAGSIAAQSLGTLRAELGLAHDLAEVLARWPGTRPAFLVVDALDAARDERTARMLRDLLSRVITANGRWHVVAAIREFDLRYGVALQRLFAGAPPTEFQSAEFSAMRHFQIPVLGDEELAQIRPQSPELADLVTNADHILRDLLRVPFNLRIAGELIGDGVAVAELTPIRTQLELLDRYWTHRIVGEDGRRTVRERVLRLAAEEMVGARELRVDRAQIEPAVEGSTLDDLLSAQLLVAWRPTPTARPDDSVLLFPHHILFDYAVARLLLDGQPDRLTDRLRADPSLVIAIRPSLVFRFQRAWSDDLTRSVFWDLVAQVDQSSEVPAVGKLIGPAVAAESCSRVDDFAPLLAALSTGEAAAREGAEQVLQHTVAARLAIPELRRPLIGDGAGPWCALLDATTKIDSAPLAYMARRLLGALCERPQDFTAAQRTLANAAARRLVQYAWMQAVPDRWLSAHGLEAVCRTYEGAQEASALLVDRAVTPDHLAVYGFVEMPQLAREAKRLIPIDPTLVEAIYQAAFAYEEASDAPTDMGSGLIMPLRSNRRQDYELALFQLGEIFAEFLEQASLHATRALITAIDRYAPQHHPEVVERVPEEYFAFVGLTARLQADFSVSWDSRGLRSDGVLVKMLAAFDAHLDRLAQDPDRGSERRQFLELLASKNRYAVLWKRLIAVGVRAPQTLGSDIRALAWAAPILAGRDTTVAIGDLLKAIFTIIEPDEREMVERAILAIRTVAADGRQFGITTRNRLLGCLPVDALVTEEARETIASLGPGDVPENAPLSRISRVESAPFGEAEFLAMEGVPVDETPNKRIRDLARSAEEFAREHLNEIPLPERIESIFPELQALAAALDTAVTDGVHERQQDYAWGHLAEACERAARSAQLPCDSEIGSFLRNILLRASEQPSPEYQPESDEQFDENPHWGGASARVDAAEGLVRLAGRESCADAAVLAAVERLSQDSVPAVRLHIARCLHGLYSTAPKLMWRIIERICRDEPRRAVLTDLMRGPLDGLIGPHTDRVVPLVQSIFMRVTDGAGADAVRDASVSLFLWAYLWSDNPIARDVILAIVETPGEAADACRHIAHDLRPMLSFGAVDPPDPKHEAARQQAIGLVRRMLEAAQVGLATLRAFDQAMPFGDRSPDEQERIRSLAQLIDVIGHEIFFASGAFAEENPERRTNGRVLTAPEKDRFLTEMRPLFELLADFGFPGLVHILLDTLASLISVDPAGVLVLIDRIIRAGQQYGYQHEPVAVGLMVKILQRYLADYRALFRENAESQRLLLEILDVFVQVGWPAALRLTFRLEEIFR